MYISRILRVVLIGSLLLGVVGIGATIALSAQQKGVRRVVPHTGGLTVEDYIEITQLYGLYTRDIDPGATRDAAWTFSPDGAIQMERNGKGEKEVKEYYENVLKRARKNGTRHVTTTYVIVGTPNGTVRGSAYNLSLQRTAEGKPLEFQSMGKYEDTLVKTPKGWRFKERIWRSDTYVGDDVNKILPSPIAPVN